MIKLAEKFYIKSKLEEFKDDFEAMSISEKYSTLITIASGYYGIGINGLQIEKLTFDENILEITTANNRKIQLRIVDDLEIKISPEK